MNHFTSIFKLILLASFLAITTLVSAKKPNVLFIVCDDLNTHVSTSGYQDIITPAFDELAASGMTFRRAYCQYPVCGPSRASFLHGMYPQSTGVLDNKSDIRNAHPDVISLPQKFKDSGYWTGAVGKVFHTAKMNHGSTAWDENMRFENEEMPMVTPIREKFEEENGSIKSGKARRKWREFYPTIATQTRGQQPGYGPSGLEDDQHKDGKNARQVASWLNNSTSGEKPFFIACGIQKPHVPFLAPDKYFELYPKSELNIAPASAEHWKAIPKIAQTKRYKGFGFEFGLENDSLRRDYVQAYHACISFIDAQIGLVLDALKESGHWEDTIVVLTSDHGYMLGEKFMWGKVMLFEQCDRVPLVIRVPKSLKTGATTPGSSTDGLVELIDIYPTLTDLCDLDHPNNIQGISILPMLNDPSADGKKIAYTVVTRGREIGKAIRTTNFRYTWWPTGEELYNLNKDPKEERNLAKMPKHSETIQVMRSHLSKVEEFAKSQMK